LAGTSTLPLILIFFGSGITQRNHPVSSCLDTFSTAIEFWATTKISKTQTGPITELNRFMKRSFFAVSAAWREEQEVGVEWTHHLLPGSAE
jgi:hypothetical protein